MRAQTRLATDHSDRRHGRTVPLPAKEFAETLRTERERADREGSEFSLVAIRVPENGTRGARSQDLLHALSARCRKVDAVGWIDGQYLGVLLPVTCPEGSNRFVEEVSRGFASSPLPHAIFHYGEKSSYLSSRSRKAGEETSVDHSRSDLRGEGVGPDGVAVLEDQLKDVFVQPIPPWKRILDLIGASLALLLFSPVALFLCVYIKLVSPGPILFKQQRIGYKGKAFTFLKFRTMYPGNNQSDHCSHLKDLIRSERPMEKLDEVGDKRIIPGGRLVRKSCMDELPQFLNVLRGEMSLVGPRPCLPYEVEEFRRWHANRFDVLPGITGPWQVGGKNKLTFSQMIRLDVSYCRSLSLGRDLKVLLLTPVAILRMVAEAAVHQCGASVEATGEANAELRRVDQ